MALGMLIHAFWILPSQAASPHRVPVSILGTLKAVAANRDFLRYWWIAALVFACYFALISVTPLIFMDALKLSEYQYALVLMVYGVAYLLGGVAASYLQKRMALSRQINIGLGLLLVAGALLTLIVSLNAISTLTLLIPMLISALAVTLVRPAAISAAMLSFSSSAGTAASAGNSIMFLTAAISSAALAQAGDYLLITIAIGFIALSLWADDQQPCGPLRLPNHRRKQHIAGLQLQITGFDQRNLSFADIVDQRLRVDITVRQLRPQQRDHDRPIRPSHPARNAWRLGVVTITGARHRQHFGLAILIQVDRPQHATQLARGVRVRLSSANCSLPLGSGPIHSSSGLGRSACSFA